MNFVLSLPFEISEVVFVSLLYLFIDLYPSVRSFRAMLTTASFLLLWVIFSVLTAIAYFFLTTTALAKAQGLVGPTIAKLTLIVLGALMGATILQSLSLKISESKILDFNLLIQNYRQQVIVDMTKKNSTIERLRALHLADRLSGRFRDNPAGITEEYSQLLLTTGQTPESVAQVIRSIKRNSDECGISPVKLIAGSIARLDHMRAKQLLS